MADGSPRFSTPVATPPRLSSRSGDDPTIEPSVQCLRSLLLGSAPATVDEPSNMAGRMTLESQAFILDLVAVCGGESPRTGDTTVARIVPSASAMLGWEEEKPETDDQFAARLMAAFQSGALEVKPRVIDDYPLRTQAAAPSFSDGRKRPLPRGPAALRSDRQHQRYAVPGLIGRPLYTPW